MVSNEEVEAALEERDIEPGDDFEKYVEMMNLLVDCGVSGAALVRVDEAPDGYEGLAISIHAEGFDKLRPILQAAREGQF